MSQPSRSKLIEPTFGSFESSNKRYKYSAQTPAANDPPAPKQDRSLGPSIRGMPVASLWKEYSEPDQKEIIQSILGDVMVGREARIRRLNSVQKCRDLGFVPGAKVRRKTVLECDRVLHGVVVCFALATPLHSGYFPLVVSWTHPEKHYTWIGHYFPEDIEHDK